MSESRKRAMVAIILICLLVGTTIAGVVLYMMNNDSSETSSQISGSSIASKMDEYFNACVENGSFSGSVLIAKGGQVIFKNGYGMCNYELDVKNTPDTRFNIGSITKQFTAAAILQLEERGVLSTNDLLSKYVPDFPSANKITIDQILHHTSGIPNIDDYFVSTRAAVDFYCCYHTEDEMMKFIKTKSLISKPGEQYYYSNVNYYLLGFIIEKVSGKSYDVYLKENIFDKIGMADTGYAFDNKIIKNHTAGYMVAPDGFDNAQRINVSYTWAAGGLYSTVKDLYEWDRALYTEKILKKSTIERMCTPQLGNYGCGVRVLTNDNHKCVYLRGALLGYSGVVLRYINDDATIIILNNMTNTQLDSISKIDITAILFGEKYSIPQKRKVVSVPQETLDKYVGTYELISGNGSSYSMSEEQGNLYINGYLLFAESDTKFFAKDYDIEITFIKDDNGNLQKVTIIDSRKANDYKRTGDLVLPSFLVLGNQT